MLLPIDHAKYAGEGTTSGRTGPLAFGLPELTVLMTPIMLAAMTEVVRYIISQAVERGWKVTAQAIRRLFRVNRSEAAAAEAEALRLAPEQWAEVHRIVEQVALRGGVGADLAQQLADAVVGQGQLGGSR